MKTMMREMRAVWDCAFTFQCQGVFKYLLWLLVALHGIVPVFTWFSNRNFTEAVGSLSLPFSLLFLCCWLTLNGGAIRQNSSANAKLVPHLHTRLIQLIITTGLLGISIDAFFFSFLDGRFEWNFIWMLLYAIGIAWGQTRRFGWPISVIVIAHTLFRHRLPSDIVATLTSDDAFLLWLASGLLLGVFFIKSSFPRGGDSNWLIQQRSQRQRAQSKDPFGFGKDSSAWTLLPYYRSLRIACASRRKSLAILVLGPNCHWGAVVPTLSMVAITIILLKVLSLAFPALMSLDFVKGFGWSLASSMSVVILLTAQNVALQFSNTRGEQALYRLTAHAPEAKALNRALANGIVRTKMQGFLIVLAVNIGCSLLLGMKSREILTELAASSLILPYFCLQLRDYSHEVMLNIGYARVWQVLGLLVLPPSMGLLMIAPTSLTVWMIIAITGMVSGAALIAYRWRNMVGAKAAFPAGRITS